MYPEYSGWFLYASGFALSVPCGSIWSPIFSEPTPSLLRFSSSVSQTPPLMIPSGDQAGKSGRSWGCGSFIRRLIITNPRIVIVGLIPSSHAGVQRNERESNRPSSSFVDDPKVTVDERNGKMDVDPFVILCPPESVCTLLLIDTNTLKSWWT